MAGIAAGRVADGGAARWRAHATTFLLLAPILAFLAIWFVAPLARLLVLSLEG